NTLTYATENVIVEVHFDHAGQGVVATRREDGRWDAHQVQYQPASATLAVGQRYTNAPALFHPATGEKLVAVTNGNSFYAIVTGDTPTEALTSFEAAFQEEN